MAKSGEFHPECDCHFNGRLQEDIKRELQAIVFEINEKRSITREEEAFFKQVANEISRLLLANHTAKCAKDRAEALATGKKDNRDWVSLLVSAVAAGIALLAIFMRSKG
ncbi:hypothetical protein DRO66_01895 [Candidatus Bathyarchaeota archaeon]|nr:MAG: hypothetical protein DRO66_01895 [Candidatus Bathyarchaeota archaeon]